MIRTRLSFINPENGIADRGRRIGFYAAIIALIINNVQFVNYVTAGEFSSDLVVNNLIYNLIGLTIAICSYANYYFNFAFKSGIILLLVHIWVNALLSASGGKATIIDLPVLIFAPVMLVTFASHRLLAIVGLIQASLLYVFMTYFGARDFAKDWPPEHLQGFTMALITMSFLTIVALAAVAYARERTDKRLFDLIKEKEQLAAEDALTGLDNRRSFLTILEENIANGVELSCAFIDLDRFKPINDKYGHGIGDQVIQTIGERLSETPGVLSVARLGGDEFGMLIDMDRLNVSTHALFEALHKKLCQEIMTEAGGVAVGASIGYSVYPEDGRDSAELMHAADIAMRRTKADQIGAVRFNIAVDNTRLTRAAMEMSFKDALVNRDLRPALQPIACSQTGRIVGYEMLARWVNSNFATPPNPLDFIAIAERFGLLNELLISTLDQALALREPDSDKFLAINISPSQLSHPNFLSQLSAKLKDHNVDPNTIELEVTEQVAFRNVEHNIKMLNEARALGMRISLDDFGTGYSSLAILDTLPLDKLKIDRAFLQRHDLRTERHDVLAATIDLARKLNLTSCIEGVEDENTARAAAEMGCDLLQGYWIGRPKLVEEMDGGLPFNVKRIA